MLVDIHCHPHDYFKRSGLQLSCSEPLLALSSAWNREQFAFNKNSAATQHGFAVHPQLPAEAPDQVAGSLAALYELADSGALDAIGETGFDLFDSRFKSTEDTQSALFTEHLELAIAKGLPVLLHVRKAMHKVFSFTKELKRARAVVFHSFSGTAEDGASLLRRGVNAYFAFGGSLFHGHKQALRACALLPSERILSETDAPYQPLSGTYSSWEDLPSLVARISSLNTGMPDPVAVFHNIFH